MCFFNSRLLMGFPFINQTDEAYADYIVSLIYKKLSHKQITANSIRIYLLEEQNNELRYLNLREAVRNRGHVCSHQNKVNNNSKIIINNWYCILCCYSRLNGQFDCGRKI